MTPGERPAPPLDRSFVIEGRRFLRHRVLSPYYDDPALSVHYMRGEARVWARTEGYRVLDVVSLVEQDDDSYIVELEVGAPVSAGPDDGYDLGDPKRFRR